MTAFLTSIIPHAVTISRARSSVGVLDAALLEALRSRRIVVILAAAVGVTFRGSKLTALDDTRGLIPFAFSRTGTLVARSEEAAVLATSTLEGIPVTVRQVFAGRLSLGVHVALDGAALGRGIPVADVSVRLAVDFTEDARAVGGANTLNRVDHATRGVVGAVFEVVLELHLAGFDTSATHPFAGTAGVAVVGIGDLIAAFDANAGGIVPDAVGISITSSQVAVLVLALALASAVLVLAHVVLCASTDVVDEFAHRVATVALEVPHTVDILIARNARGILESALGVANGSADEAHGLILAFDELGDARASGGALRSRNVPQALRIGVTVGLTLVAEDADFLAGRRKVMITQGSNLAFLVLSAISIGVVIGTSHTAAGASVIPLAFEGSFATALSGLQGAGLNTGTRVARPHAGRISCARNVVRSVSDSAGIGASLVDAPLAHDGGYASTCSGAETASSTAADITVIEDAARISVAICGLIVSEFALEVATAVGNLPVAHCIGLARSGGSVAITFHLALGGDGGPLAVRIVVASIDLSVGHVLVLALFAAATKVGGPVAHGAGETSRFVSKSGTFLTAAQHEGIPHALRIKVARRLSSVAVTAGLEALLSDGNVGVEAAHGVGSAGDGESASGVGDFSLVQGAALASTFADLGVPHAVR